MTGVVCTARTTHCLIWPETLIIVDGIRDTPRPNDSFQSTGVRYKHGFR